MTSKRTAGLGARRSALGTATAAALAALAACGGSSGAGSGTQFVAPFVYVADAGGFTNLYRFRDNQALPLTSASNNTEPNSRAGRLVFTSDRDGYLQVYISDLDVATPHRVTNTSVIDQSPSLSPTADSIAFVSTRSGTPRIWLINAPALNAATFDTPVELVTGVASSTPEAAPAWNPGGSMIAFTSSSNGVSQVYTVPSGGGVAAAVTHEVGGAYQPAWSADGQTLYYVASTPALVLRTISALGGTAITVVDDPLGVSGPATCDASYCLFSTDPGGTSGAICALSATTSSVQLVFSRTGAQQRQPAFLVP